MEALVLILVVVVAVLVWVVWSAQKTPGAMTLDAAETDRVVQTLRAEIANVQHQLMQQNNEQFMALAEQRLKTETAVGEGQLKARKEEIDKGLNELRGELGKVREFVQKIDKERGDSIAKLGTVVEGDIRATEALRQTTEQLNKALAGGQTRGQWGERMAEDVLRVAGFVEGVQYRKQQQIVDGTGLTEGRGRPDFTFLLPDNRFLHMDVKFPMAEYMRYLQSDTDGDRDTTAKAFLRDVKARIKEVTTRDYIDPAGGTLDYTLVFIPNEQIYGFIHERDPSIVDFALVNKVVICSPLTLFAILAVIRQATDNFHLARQTNEILGVLDGFRKQWGMFKGGMEKVESQLRTLSRSYDDLTGTRTRQLDKAVEKVESLRTQAGIAQIDSGDDSTPAQLAISTPEPEATE